MQKDRKNSSKEGSSMSGNGRRRMERSCSSHSTLRISILNYWCGPHFGGPGSVTCLNAPLFSGPAGLFRT